MPPKVATPAKIASTPKAKAPGPAPGPAPVTSSDSRTLIVKLKVDGKKLSTFGPPSSPSKTLVAKSLAQLNHTPRNSSPLAAGGITPDDMTRLSPNKSDGTPAPSISGAINGTTTGEAKVDAVAGPAKAGIKRARGGGATGTKPGRKRAKMDGGPSAKAGPKSNQGAINEKLRALDRSGKPCKRWTKASITLKSFTGVQWSIPKWATPVVDKSLELQPSGSSLSSSEKSDQEQKAEGGEPAAIAAPNGTTVEEDVKSNTEEPACNGVPIVITPPAEDTKMVDVSA